MKSRVCEPSPSMTIGFPIRHSLMNVGTAFFLCVEKGPYTLEKRRATVRIPKEAANARQ